MFINLAVRKGPREFFTGLREEQLPSYNFPSLGKAGFSRLPRAYRLTQRGFIVCAREAVCAEADKRMIRFLGKFETVLGYRINATAKKEMKSIIAGIAFPPYITRAFALRLNLCFRGKTV